MAKYLAVQTYEHYPNPEGLPADWPAQCLELELDSADPLPAPYDDGTWAKMSQAEFDDYKSARQDSYDAWFFAKKAFDLESTSRRSSIKSRIDYGMTVVLDFRDYAVAKNLGVSDSIALMGVLSAILPYMQLGLLGPAAYLLGAVGANSFLDGEMDGSVFGVTLEPGTTVKMYFVNKILEGSV